MVQFGHQIQEQQYPPWASHYLDYKTLKKRVKDILAVLDNDQALAVLEARKHIFQGAFDSEVVKVLAFYRLKTVELDSKLTELQADIAAIPAQAAQDDDVAVEEQLALISALHSRLQEVARCVTHLLEFVGLNMRGVRKILKKFAKNVDPTPPAPGFLALEIAHPHDPNWKLLQGTYLAAGVQKDLDNMIDHLEPAAAVATIRDLNKALYDNRRQVLGSSSANLRERMEHSAGLGHMDTLLRQLDEAQDLAEANSGVVRSISWAAAQAGIFTKPPPLEQAVATTMGLALNCANSALYMANYNLVVPSIRSFLLHIGAHSALAGLVIGCCDLASMPSTVGYSKWTNTSFRRPLLFSAASCLAGNLCYCYAYDTRLLWLLYAARLLTGLGAARAVSRRYIADFVSKAGRTKASAAFVGSSALGMALGPLLAHLFVSFPQMQVGPIMLNSITMDTMASLWAIYIVLLIAFFKDPRIRIPPRRIQLTASSADELLQPLIPVLTASPGEVLAEEGTAVAPGGGKASERVIKRQNSFQYALGPTMCCVYALLVLKTAQQGFVDTLPLFTETLYGWTDAQNGVYLAVMGFSMIPVTMIMGAISARVDDRSLTLFSMMLTMVGCLQLTYGGFPRWNYFLGGVGIYMGTIIMEGAAMSLESKVLHPSFAEGTFNAGLLSTEAGTLGRFTGNLLLSVAGRITGLDSTVEIAHFARLLFGATAALLASNLIWFLPYFKRMGLLMH